MKIMMMECTAEELSANKTVCESFVDVLNRFAERLYRSDLVNANENANENENEERECEDE